MAPAQSPATRRRFKGLRLPHDAVFSAVDIGRRHRDIVVGIQVVFGLVVVAGIFCAGISEVGRGQFIKGQLPQVETYGGLTQNEINAEVMRRNAVAFAQGTPVFAQHCQHCGQHLDNAEAAHEHLAHCLGCDGSQEGGPWKRGVGWQSILSTEQPACEDGVEEPLRPVVEPPGTETLP